MDKDALSIGVFLAVLFGLSLAAHYLYVKGYAFDWAVERKIARSEIAVFESETACEDATGKRCVLELCENIPAGRGYEDICGQGYSEGWRPRAH